MGNRDLYIYWDGTRYCTDIEHQELRKYERVRGRDEYEVRQKATAKLAQWDDAWRKKVVAERRAKERQAKKELAAKRTVQARAEVVTLGRLLSDALMRSSTLDWEALKDKSTFSKPKPAVPKPSPPGPRPVPLVPERTASQYQPVFSLVDYLLPSRKREKMESASRLFAEHYREWEEATREYQRQEFADKKEHERKLAEWRTQMQRAAEEWETQRRVFHSIQQVRNAKVDLLEQAYLRGSPDAVRQYCELVISQSEYPEVLPAREHQVDYNADNRVLVVEYSLPPPDDMPKLKEVKYVQSRDALEEVGLPDSVVHPLYDNVVYQIALRTLYELYQADVVNALDMIVFNGWVNSVDRATGQDLNACIVSVQASPEEFLSLNLSQVDPKSCFRKLKGLGSPRLHGLAPVAPILQLSREDKRFISPQAVAQRLGEGENIAAMDWEDFEHLIRELFEKEFGQAGGEVKITQASRDRGVDAVAFDPDPIRGGKIVIQAKRYTNTVEVAAVRDLYGTVVNEGATKGILVTTSDYGVDAYEFAKGKPLTLLNGANLLSLLEKHGHKARIDLQEAKRLLALP